METTAGGNRRNRRRGRISGEDRRPYITLRKKKEERNLESENMKKDEGNLESKDKNKV